MVQENMKAFGTMAKMIKMKLKTLILTSKVS